MLLTKIKKEIQVKLRSLRLIISRDRPVVSCGAQWVSPDSHVVCGEAELGLTAHTCWGQKCQSDKTKPARHEITLRNKKGNRIKHEQFAACLSQMSTLVLQ